MKAIYKMEKVTLVFNLMEIVTKLINFKDKELNLILLY